MSNTETKLRGINLQVTPEANEQIKRFKRIANYVKDFSERKTFYTNKMIELFSQLSDEQIIELIKKIK